MRPFRFLHTADLHLGTPFFGLSSRISPAFMEMLREAGDGCFRRIVDIAIKESVDFVTIAGDLYDSAFVPLAVHFELRRGFERLKEQGIRVFVSHGNHDPLGTTPPVPWPDNVHVFHRRNGNEETHQVVDTVSFDLGESTRVQIAGFSYGRAEMYGSMVGRFVRDAEADFAIGLYHGAVGAFAGHDNYCQASLHQFEESCFDFWGLGHIHQPSVLRKERPTVVYPGNPQGRHIRESGPRGVTLVDVSPAGDVSLRTCQSSTVVWERISVSVEGAQTMVEVRNQVLTALSTVLETAVCTVAGRVILSGQTAVPALELSSEDFLEAMREEIAARDWPFVLERIVVETTPWLDVPTLVCSEEYIGEVLRLLREWRGDPKQAEPHIRPIIRSLFPQADGWSADEREESLTNRIEKWLAATEQLILSTYASSEVGL